MALTLKEIDKALLDTMRSVRAKNTFYSDELIKIRVDFLNPFFDKLKYLDQRKTKYSPKINQIEKGIKIIEALKKNNPLWD